MAFWTHTIWYILLVMISVTVLIVALVKSRNRKRDFAFFFAILGSTYIIELFLLVVLNGYAYHPLITPNDPFADSVAGNYFSQTSISSTALLICVLNLSAKWRMGFSVAYFFIGLLFEYLGVYEEYWYKSVYTLVGFFIYSGFIKMWYKKIASSDRFIYYVTLLLSVFAAGANSLIALFRYLHIRQLSMGIYEQTTRDHSAATFIYAPVLSVIIIALYKWKAHLGIKILVFSGLLILEYGLYKSGVFIIKRGWFSVVAVTDLLGCYFCTAVLDRFLRHRKTSSYLDIR